MYTLYVYITSFLCYFLISVWPTILCLKAFEVFYLTWQMYFISMLRKHVMRGWALVSIFLTQSLLQIKFRVWLGILFWAWWYFLNYGCSYGYDFVINSTNTSRKNCGRSSTWDDNTISYQNTPLKILKRAFPGKKMMKR